MLGCIRILRTTMIVILMSFYFLPKWQFLPPLRMYPRNHMETRTWKYVSPSYMYFPNLAHRHLVQIRIKSIHSSSHPKTSCEICKKIKIKNKLLYKNNFRFAKKLQIQYKVPIYLIASSRYWHLMLFLYLAHLMQQYW